MAANPLELLKQGFGELLQNGAFSDFVLRDSEGKVYNVHKAIVCTQSKFFQKACEPGKFKEGEESKVNLTVGGSVAISSLLEFLYTLDYGYDPNEVQSENKLLSHANVYIAADFYDVPKLKELATTRFQAALALGHVSSTPEDLPKALESTYTDIPSSDRALRDAALSFIVDNISVCLRTSETSGLTIIDVMTKVLEFGRDLTMRMVNELEKLQPEMDRWTGQGFRKVQCQDLECLHIWADARAVIPNDTHCPKCGGRKSYWDNYRVD
ncbi:hypothetical protein FKW77_000179 [Venturia effusa]|uniref:BTB domain-containing protein n=1 Tax=Venturia effusa TaxID=50376 RepID=A0A517L2J1_9PEZI|nr:hypothetical protein FKW77_000179 [Venturia effusa]